MTQDETMEARLSRAVRDLGSLRRASLYSVLEQAHKKAARIAVLVRAAEADGFARSDLVVVCYRVYGSKPGNLGRTQVMATLFTDRSAVAAAFAEVAPSFGTRIGRQPKDPTKVSVAAWSPDGFVHCLAWDPERFGREASSDIDEYFHNSLS